MYDESVVRLRQRVKIPGDSGGRCAHCRALGIDTASELEWPCLILQDWICETHCSEVQLLDYKSTREAVAEQIELQGSADRLLSMCAKCPYGDRVEEGSEEQG